MQHKVSKVVLLVALGCASLTMAWFLGIAGASAAGNSAKAHARANVTVITVTAGKPSEFAFKL